MDDPAWQLAQMVELTEPVQGLLPRYHTTARLLYTAECLYIGFSCEDAYVWGTYTERDAPIYDEECVEAFLCPSGRMRQYYEINVSPRNTVFDAFILNRTPLAGPRDMRSFVDYTCDGLRTAVHVDGALGSPGARGWSVEYAVPFRALVGSDHLIPEPGDKWLMNLCRVDTLENRKQEFYAWATMGKVDFHLPWQFGTLRFC